MSTIRDVAEKAGVAPVTVSRVINDSGYVSARTRKRVEAAIQELHYMPNKVARSLRMRRTHTLALVLTDITNPFWPAVARGVEDTAHQAGYNLILCNTDESRAKQEAYLHVLLQKQVDGILLVPADNSIDPIEFIQSRDIPLVLLDRQVSQAAVDIVRGDSEHAAYQLVQTLVDRGHRRIVALAGPQSVSTAADRVRGYRRALREAGIQAPEQWIYFGEFNQASGYENTQAALQLQPLPTALFAANNFIAIGALRALRQAGLRVPEDMALVTFDDRTMIVEPFLTVANQPAYEMGQRATELLLARLSGSASAAYQEIILPTEILIRKSSGAPLANAVAAPDAQPSIAPK
jgi:LacI family transcriptional regulator